MAKVVIFEDDFDDNILDTEKWDKIECGDGYAKEQNQRMEFDCIYMMDGACIRTKDTLRLVEGEITFEASFPPRAGSPYTYGLGAVELNIAKQKVDLGYNTHIRYLVDDSYTISAGILPLNPPYKMEVVAQGMIGGVNLDAKVVAVEDPVVTGKVKLKLMITNDTVEFYYDVGGGWVKFHTLPYQIDTKKLYLYIEGHGSNAAQEPYGYSAADNLVVIAEEPTPAEKMAEQMGEYTTNFMSMMMLMLVLMLFMSIWRALRGK